MTADARTKTEEGLRFLIYVQWAYPDIFQSQLAAFEAKLGKQGIPWSLTSAEFEEELKLFHDQLRQIITDAEATIDSTVPKAVIDSLTAELVSLPLKKKLVNREFVHNLTQTFVENLKKERPLDNETKLKQAIEGSIQTLLDAGGPPREIEPQIPTLLTRAVFLSQEKQPEVDARASQPIAAQVTAQFAEVIPWVVAPDPPVEEIFKRTLANARVTNKGLLLRTMYLGALENPGAPLGTIATQAEKLVLVAEALTSVVPRGADITRPSFFAQATATGAAKLLGQAGDLVLTVFPLDTREKIIEAALGRAWQEATAPENLSRVFGPQTINAPLVKSALAAGHKIFPQPEAAAGGVRGLVRGAFMKALLLPPARSAVDDFLKATRLEARAQQIGLAAAGPPGTSGLAQLFQAPPVIGAGGTQYLVFSIPHFYLAAVHAHLPRFHLEFLGDVGAWILRFGAQKAAAGGVRQAAAAAALVGAKGVTTRIIAALGGTIAGGPVGTILGWFGAEALTRIFGALTRGVRRIFSFLAGAPAGAPRKDLFGLEGWLLPLILVAGLLLATGGALFTLTTTSSAFPITLDPDLIGKSSGSGAGAVYAPADYINLAKLGKFDLFNTSQVRGVTTDQGTSRPLTPEEQTRIARVIGAYPQLAAYSGPLGGAPKINLTAFSFADPSFYGYAPNKYKGNIVLYSNAFSSDFRDESLARLIAHELAHQVEWFYPQVYEGYLNGKADGSSVPGYCGPLGTYVKGYPETSEETFAEAAAIYLLNQQDPATGQNLLLSRCPTGFTFMQKLFGQ